MGLLIDFDGMPNRKFYGKKAPPTPKGVKGIVIRDEPQSDSEVSDISVDDSEEEYYPSQDDSAMPRKDLKLDYQDEDRIIMGRSRRRTLLPELSARSAGPSSDMLPGPSRMSVAMSSALPNCVDVIVSHKVDEHISTRVTGSTVPVEQQRREEEEEVEVEEEEEVEVEEEEEEVEEQTYQDLKNKLKWTVCNPEENNERPIPDWQGCLLEEGTALDPIQYLRKFFDYELLTLICTESNRYALQRDSSKPLGLTIEELEIFLGICIYMSVVKLSQTRRYWCPEANIRDVANFMSRKRWERIKSCLHFADNAEMPEKGTPEYDKLYKVRPYVNILKEKFNKIPMNMNVCVDEMMVPYKGSRGPRYYIKSKPNSWGFKVWTLADSFGIVHNFEICVGKTQKVDGFPDLKSSANTVCKLAAVIPNHKNHRLFMDNLFSTVPQYYEMFNRGILCMGTVRSNRLAGLKLIPDKELKSKG
ncbi:hypothetical protein Pmani_003843 [Petrolisthes manimaculis]|uniref:PiggyBac transposable element-derived protein domain-containing protein n=1 Tax=Petrolisthes manimaculis TaxID=1843537 RepID=A0AAE1UM39_9EUCA|nr:hypothetical protein Pmani_003843 [Petrolisthes manimaculis]